MEFSHLPSINWRTTGLLWREGNSVCPTLHLKYEATNYNYRRIQSWEEKPKQKPSKLLENKISEFFFFLILWKGFNLWKVCASNHAGHECQLLVTKLDTCRAMKRARLFPIHKPYNSAIHVVPLNMYNISPPPQSTQLILPSQYNSLRSNAFNFIEWLLQPGTVKPIYALVFMFTSLSSAPSPAVDWHGNH